MGMDPAAFGRFLPVAADAVPDVPRRLLDHRSHMTVAMERFHGGPVALRVVAERPAAAGSGDRYAREILLVRGDGMVVQHGIVRIDLAAVPAQTAAAIRPARTSRRSLDVGPARSPMDASPRSAWPVSPPWNCSRSSRPRRRCRGGNAGGLGRRRGRDFFATFVTFPKTLRARGLRRLGRY
jgi:hypothetical protein